MPNQAEAKTGAQHRPIVLHVVQSLRAGGAETFVRELIPRLMCRGIDARVLCAYGESQLTQAEAQTWAGEIYCQERGGIPRLAYLQKMRQLMRQVAPDIVHTHTHVGASWGRAAAVLERIPTIIHTEHSSETALSTLERVAFAMLNRRTDATVTFSERAARLVRERDKVRELHVIPNGIPVHQMPSRSDRLAARQKLDIDHNQIVLGMVANLLPEKNPQLGIDAIARLLDRRSGFAMLAIFGDGPLRDDLLIHTRKLGLEKHVRFYGFRTDMEELLPGLDLIVTTSLREMMPMSLLEAMNAALPIIGTPHSGMLDLVVNGETGIILGAWDHRQLAEAIEWAVSHPDWRDRAGRAAYTRLKENFDIENVADRHVELYRRLLGRN